MKVSWKRGLIEISIWLMGEIFLNLSGLDTLADYGEFVRYGKMQPSQTYQQLYSDRTL